MTNRIAVVLAFLIVGFLLADHLWFNLGAALFLGRRFIEFVEYLAFWR